MSVVVCAYTEDRWPDLRRALASAAAQVPAPVEVILVVDHAPALLARARAELEGVRVVESTGPKGLSGARNSGIAAASGEVVAFLDDDAHATPGWLVELTAPYADPAVIGTGGRADAEWDEARPAWFPREFDWVVGCSYVGMPETAASVRNPLGCNMSFRRAVFGIAGGFSEEVGRVGQLPSGCEETELCIRAGRALPGSSIVLVPGASVGHRVPARRGTLRYFTSRCWHEGRSKAVVTRLAGGSGALSTERTYTTRTLPAAVLRGMADLLRGQPAGAARAGAVVWGLGVTTAGYLAGRAMLAARAGRPPAERPEVELFAAGQASPQPPPESADDGLVPPVCIVEVELSRPLPALEAASGADAADEQARSTLLFVRLHGAPLGFVRLRGEARPGSDELAAAIQDALGPAIAAHLRADGLAPSGPLTPVGLDGPAPCADALAAFAAAGPPLTVAIPTRDRPDLVVACVGSVLATRYPRLEVVVVDNAPSSDATSEAIAERFGALPDVRYVRTPTAGTAHARNLALRAATSDVVAFLDDDVLVDPGWAASVARPFAEDERVGCVTGMIVAVELETWPQLWIEEYGGFGKGFEPVVFDLAAPPDGDALFPYTAGRFGSGANMAFRRSAIRRRGFDLALGGATPARGGEDLAAFVDVLLDGWRIAYEPRAFVRHHHHREYERLRRVMYGYGSGLGAYLGRLALEHPGRLADVATRLARGAAYLLDPRSGKNARKRPGYPAELTRLELAGLVVGPFAYARGRLLRRSARRTAMARAAAERAAGKRAAGERTDRR